MPFGVPITLHFFITVTLALVAFVLVSGGRDFRRPLFQVHSITYSVILAGLIHPGTVHKFRYLVVSQEAVLQKMADVICSQLWEANDTVTTIPTPRFEDLYKSRHVMKFISMTNSLFGRPGPSNIACHHPVEPPVVLTAERVLASNIGSTVVITIPSFPVVQSTRSWLVGDIVPAVFERKIGDIDDVFLLEAIELFHVFDPSIMSMNAFIHGIDQIKLLIKRRCQTLEDYILNVPAGREYQYNP
ncbi:hypothetical protein DFS33DRAFT_1456813 [Desarmillaria ectypa]|nr:hypothetical protein DFS33DRAFT_1456813 [Desarmillaria ectypa]